MNGILTARSVPSPAHARVVRTLLIALLAVASARAFADDGLDARVACQATLADLTWREMLWPDANPEPKPPRAAVLSDSELRDRVLEQGQMESVLASDYGIRVDARMLQRELDRIAASTRAPDRLMQRYAALGYDADRIGDCLVRPQLVESRLRAAYANDKRRHGATRRRAEQSLRHAIHGRKLGGPGHPEARRLLLVNRDRVPTGEVDRPASIEPREQVELDAQEFSRELARLSGSTSIHPAAQDFETSATPVLQEYATEFLLESVLSSSETHIELLALTWRKTSFEEWWRTRSKSVSYDPGTFSRRGGLVVRPDLRKLVAGAREAGDAWRQGGTGVASTPLPRTGHSAVWTGTEMLIWGGSGVQPPTEGGWRYNPVLDRWTPMATLNSPASTTDHSTVWTGSEMIVWGGGPGRAGGRYDPTTDTWRATNRRMRPAPVFNTLPSGPARK
jgi:hypothetical protein